MKISLRRGPKLKHPTSITLRDDIVSLWILFTGREDTNYFDECVNFVDACMEIWESTNGRGLSKFVMNNMMKDILEDSDFNSYNQILNVLQ